jgi:hypothetical protein
LHPGAIVDITIKIGPTTLPTGHCVRKVQPYRAEHPPEIFGGERNVSFLTKHLDIKIRYNSYVVYAGNRIVLVIFRDTGTAVETNNVRK